MMQDSNYGDDPHISEYQGSSKTVVNPRQDERDDETRQYVILHPAIHEESQRFVRKSITLKSTGSRYELVQRHLVLSYSIHGSDAGRLPEEQYIRVRIRASSVFLSDALLL